jgi:hypothetical protein
MGEMAPPVSHGEGFGEAVGEEAEGCWSSAEGKEMGLNDEHAVMLEKMTQKGPPAAPGMEGAASHHASGLSINFDEEDAPLKVHTSALEALFADDPEVKAQREILAANRESLTGFNMNRTASSKGAKKLGNVLAAKESPKEVSLDALWERP